MIYYFLPGGAEVRPDLVTFNAAMSACGSGGAWEPIIIMIIIISISIIITTTIAITITIIHY